MYSWLPGAKAHFSIFDTWLQKSPNPLRLGGVWKPKRHFGPKSGFWGVKPYFSRSVGGEAPAAILGASASSQLPLQLPFQLRLQLHPSTLTSTSTAVLACTLTSSHEVQPLPLNIRFYIREGVYRYMCIYETSSPRVPNWKSE